MSEIPALIPVTGVHVYATTYRCDDPADNTTHDLGWLPAPPAVGNTVHYSTTDDPGDSLAWHVSHVSWVQGDERVGIPGQWHLEIALSG